jgi:hypothetical protein
MPKRKLKPFYGSDGEVVWVPETAVNKLMNSFGEIKSMEIEVSNGQAIFRYKTDLGKGEIVFFGQKS